MTPSGARLLAWARRNSMFLVATGAVIAMAAFLLVSTLDLAEERQARLNAIEQLARQQCEGINATNSTVRFILDAALRLRSPDNPISPGLRQAYIDAYRRLPFTDCTTGERTDFSPPFPTQGERP